MFLGDSKFHKLMVIIAFTAACIIMTLVFVLPYLISENKPPLRAVLFVVIFDIFWILAYFLDVRKR